MKRTFALVLVLALGACGDTAPPPAAAESEAGESDAADDTGLDAGDLVVAVMKGAAFGQHYIGKAREVATPQLLQDLAASDPDIDTTPLEDGALDAAAERLQTRWPADFREVLAVPAAWRTLGWSDPADYERGAALDDALGTKLELDEDWRSREVVIENFHGGSFRVPASAFERYVVIAQNDFFDDVVLFDPSESPQYPCCRIIETPVFESDTVTGYASVRDYLEVAWAMMKVDE